MGRDNIKRATLIFDALLHEFERQGFKIAIEEHGRATKTAIYVDDENVFLQIRERGRREKKKKDNEEEKSYWDDEWEYIPTGDLKIGIQKNYWGHTQRIISDTKSKMLEDRLDEVLPKILELIEELKKEREERRAWHQKMEQEQKEKEEKERQHKLEAARRKELEAQAKNYAKSKYIYQFIEEVEAQAEEIKLEPLELKKLSQWVHWAREHAERLDPIKQVLIEIQKKD